MRRLWIIGLCVSVLAQTTDVARIRVEAREHSQILQTLHILTDRYGPRLTGSPNLEAADAWAVDQLKHWGLKNTHLEAWEFGHPGWVNDRSSGYITAPVQSQLSFQVVAWTPSTNGAASGDAIEIVPPFEPTRVELANWLERQPDVAGKIVLTGRAAILPVNFLPPLLRLGDAEARARVDSSEETFIGRAPRIPRQAADRLTAPQADEILNQWLIEQGALLRVLDSGRDHGEIQAACNSTYDPAKSLPAVVLRNEDYGRIERLLGDGENVRLEFSIANRFLAAGHTAHNVIAEIPGSGRADEIVMLGAHLDSWHTATGATDNAIGSAIMLEAVRILEALDLHPRRTIRLALWSGEEQGLLGSRDYVARHFGTFEHPQPDFGKLTAYLNLDSGTGRIRGANVFGPAESARILAATLAPFADWGVVGASAHRNRAEGASDHTSFNAAGLPGVRFHQDPIEYRSDTWHTNLDTYERIVPEDVKSAAAVIAATAWQLATRDEMLPRFSADQMPAPLAQ